MEASAHLKASAYNGYTVTFTALHGLKSVTWKAQHKQTGKIMLFC